MSPIGPPQAAPPSLPSPRGVKRASARLARLLVPLSLLCGAAGPARAAVQEASLADAGTPAPAPAAGGDLLLLRPVVQRVLFEGADATGLRALVPIQDGAPLDARDVRDAVRALHASARFSRVAAFAEEVPGASPPAVRVVFVLAPVQKLTQVTFRGHKVLAESILHQTANLQVNAEFQPELVQRAVEAIKAAYHRVGYQNVTIASLEQEIDNGVQLTLAIDEGQATRVAQVLFTGELGMGSDELLAAFKLGGGDVLNLGLVEEGVKGVHDHYRQAGRLRARVDPAQVELVRPGEARITVPVQAGPLIRFHVRGNDSFTDSLLLSKLAVDGEEPLDVQMAQDLSQRLRRFYVQAGFAGVKIAWREIRTSDDAVELVFSVEEGPQTRVEQIVFSGNLGVPSSQLRERVVLQLNDAISADPAYGADPGELARRGVMGRVRGQPPDRTRVDPETVFDPVLYARAIKQIEDLYKSQGYLGVQAGPAKLEPLEKKPAAAPAPAGAKPALRAKAPYPLPVERMRVLIPIKEGDRSVVSLLVIEGGSEVKAEILDRAVTLRNGGPFSYYSAEEGRSAIAAAFTREGYFYAKVEDDETFFPPGPADAPGIARVEVRYRVQAGPLVHVAFVEVVGERHTQEQLILDLVKLRPGDVLTPDGLDKGQQQLLLTGLFFSATLTPRNPEVAEAEKTVLVQVRERPRRELLTSFGFSLEDGPRVSVQYTYGNLFGRNLTFNAIGRANLPYQRFGTTPPKCTTLSGTDGVERTDCQTSIIFPSDPLERVIDLGFSVPRLEPLTEMLRASLDFIHERDIRLTYDLTKWFSVQLSTALNRAQPFAASLTYEVGYQDLQLKTRTLEQELAAADSNIFRQKSGGLIFGSLRPTLTLDLRDDLARPRGGVYFQALGDLLHSFPRSPLNVRLLKLQGLAAGYVPLPGQASLVVSARAGRVFKLDGDDGPSIVPGDRLFYLGGATTLRGFHQDALQPSDVLKDLRTQIAACNTLVGNLNLAPGETCSTRVKILQAGTSSSGGEVMLAFGAELRVPILTTLEIAFFVDAGSLWADPRRIGAVDWADLSKAVGFGFRYLTPIGRIAVDIGFNLAPDQSLGDPPWYPYFAIDSL